MELVHQNGASMPCTFTHNMQFSRRLYTVIRAYILHMGGPRNQTHYPDITIFMLFQLSFKLSYEGPHTFRDSQYHDEDYIYIILV